MTLMAKRPTFQFRMQALHWASLVGISLGIAPLIIAGCFSQPESASTNKQNQEPTGAFVGEDGAADQFLWKCSVGTVWDLEFSPKSDNVLVLVKLPGSKRIHRVVIVRIPDGKERYSFETIDPASACFSADGKRLVVLAGDDLTVHDLDEKRVTLRIDRQSFGRNIRAIGLSPDGALIVGGEWYSQENQIAWNATTGEAVPIPAGDILWHGWGLAPKGNLYAIGGFAGPTPRIIKTDGSGRLTYCYRKSPPKAAKFTPDSENFVTIHEDGVLVLWELKSTDNENANQILTAHGFDGCHAFAISKDQKWIVTASKNGSVRMRDMPGGR